MPTLFTDILVALIAWLPVFMITAMAWDVKVELIPLLIIWWASFRMLLLNSTLAKYARAYFSADYGIAGSAVLGLLWFGRLILLPETWLKIPIGHPLLCWLFFGYMFGEIAVAERLSAVECRTIGRVCITTGVAVGVITKSIILFGFAVDMAYANGLVSQPFFVFVR